MQPWIRRVPSIVGVVLLGGALFCCAAMPRGMGIGCDVYRVCGRVLDGATGSPLADVWVTVRPEVAAVASLPEQRESVLEVVIRAQAIEREARAQRGSAPASDPAFVAPPAVDAARSGPDGAFELEMHVWHCDAVGGLFTRENEPRDPPRYRSLWVVTSEGLVAVAELPAAGWTPASPVPREFGEPEATLVLGDIRLPERR